MIRHSFYGYGEWMLNDVMHIAKVRHNNRKVCAGVIVSPIYVLIPRLCTNSSEPAHSYTVEFGAPRINPIRNHHVQNILPVRYLSLLLFDPQIRDVNRLSQPIELADEPLAEDMHLVIIAWRSTGLVRAITAVHIVDLDTCIDVYEHIYAVSPFHICTAQLPGGPPPELNKFIAADHGSALVVGDKLYGVLAWAGITTSPHHPDVFIRVDNEYRPLIMAHIHHGHPNNQGR